MGMIRQRLRRKKVSQGQNAADPRHFTGGIQPVNRYYYRPFSPTVLLIMITRRHCGRCWLARGPGESRKHITAALPMRDDCQKDPFLIESTPAPIAGSSWIAISIMRLGCNLGDNIPGCPH